MAEKVMKYVAQLKIRPLFLYLDATGSIVKVPTGIKPPIYVYAVVLPGIQNCGPLEVATWIAANHGISDFIICAEKIAYTFRLFSSRQPVVDKIETDFNLVLLQCISKAFNGIKLSVYLQQIYDEIIGIRTKSALTVLHICSSHLIKTALKKIKTYFDDEDTVRLASLAITKLIHAQTLNEAGNIFKQMIIVFGLRFCAKSFTKSAKYLFGNNENDEIQKEFIQHDFDNAIHNDCRKDSPFFKYFNEIKEITVKDTDVTKQKNSQYSEDFIKYLLNTLLPYFPLWSALQIKEFGITRDTNATVENWWKIEKYYNLDGAKKVLAPRYIQAKEEVLEDRLRERKFDLTTSRQERKKKIVTNRTDKNEAMKAMKVNSSSVNETKELFEEKFPQETWKRTKKNVYFETSRYLTIRQFQLDDIHSSNVRKTINNKKQNSRKQRKTLIKDIEKQSKNIYELSDVEMIDVYESAQSNYYDSGQSIEKFWNNFFSHDIDYPKGFPNIKHSFDGLNINEQVFETLNHNAYLEDNVINAFFKIAANNSKQISALAFELYLTHGIIRDRQLSVGFHNYVSSIDFAEYKVILVPLHLLTFARYALLIIIPQLKIFIYLDSLHRMPPDNFIDTMCSFYDAYATTKRKSSKSPENWSQWTLYIPDDIPKQVDKAGNINGNCGVHVCTWAYILCSGNYKTFSDDDMTYVRKIIANLIAYNSEIRQLKINKDNCNVAHENLTISGKSEKKMIYQRHPPIMSFESTFEFLASLHIILYCK